jgi:hypothetical protein
MDKKNNKILWEGSYKRDISNLSWIYHLNPDMNYDILLKDILVNDVIPSMKTKLRP